MTVTASAPPGTSVRIASITPGHRSDRELGDLTDLAASIAADGLIHPVVLSTTSRMVSGRRRLAACTLLGWTQIPAHTVTGIWEALEHMEAELADPRHTKPLSVAEAMGLDAALGELQWWPKGGKGDGSGPHVGKERTERISRLFGLNRQQFMQARILWEATQGYRKTNGARHPVDPAGQARAAREFATIREPRHIRGAYERYRGEPRPYRRTEVTVPGIPSGTAVIPMRRLPQRPVEDQLRAGLASMSGTLAALLAACPPGVTVTSKDACVEDIARLIRDLSTLRRRLTRKSTRGTE